MGRDLQDRIYKVKGDRKVIAKNLVGSFDAGNREGHNKRKKGV